MKAIKVFAAISLIISMLTMSAAAAEFVPSIEYKDGVQLIDVTLDEIDTPCRTVHIIPFLHIYQDDIIDEVEIGLDDYENSEAMEEAIRESLRNALEELQNHSLTDLVPGFAEKWAEIAGGAPLENAAITDLFEIILICSEKETFITDEQITVSFTVDGLTAGDTFLIIHKPTDSDTWVIEEYVVDENNVITMTLDRLSPFAIVKDSGEAPVATVFSPQTGINEVTAVAAVIGVAVLGACGVVIGKKFRKTGVQ